MSSFQKYLDANLEKVQFDDFSISNGINTIAQIGSIIKSERKRKNISQTELSKRSGVTQANISKIERGCINVTLKQIDKIIKALNMRLEIEVVSNE